MKTESTLLSVSVLVEEDAEAAQRVGWRTASEEEIRKAVLAAIAVLLRDHPHVKVKWASSSSIPLDGKPQFGRCAVCNTWVFDLDADPDTPGAGGVSRGAKVDGRFRCDEHLPHGHPYCFAGRGYDGPVPGVANAGG